MHLLGPCLLLLLEHLAFSDSNLWNFKHPATLYAWEGACVWIPCTYGIPKTDAQVDRLVVFHNHEYDKTTKCYVGTVLYNSTVDWKSPSQQGRVQFLGDSKSNCTLSIQSLSVNDSGRLGLRMMTKDDKWMETVNLSISKSPFPPRIQLPPELQESQTVTATCLLNFTCFGYDIELRWALKGLPFTPASSTISSSPTTQTVSTKSQIDFKPEWTHHGKNLTCQVWHSAEVLSEEMVQLNVKHTPKLEIKVFPNETTVMEGASVTMTCQVTSSNPEHGTVSWLKDGTLLGEKNLSLTLSSVTKDSGGKYRCQASNHIGLGMSEEVALKVLYPPTVSEVYIHHTPAKEGQSVELVCTSPANPPPTNYTWYHNGKEVPGVTEEKYWITQVLTWHAGRYACVAENRLGSGQVGQEAELDVQYPPKGVTTVIESPTPIREGDSVTLRCRYNSSNPTVTRYEWSPQGLWNEPSHEVMKIQNVAWDTPPISCSACNQWCLPASPIDLDVQYAPKEVKVLQISSLSEIHAGNQVRLQCHFSKSHPEEVHFFWKKNGSLLEAKGRELNFDSVSPEDAGNYSCLVKNSIGQSASEAWRLQVLYAPRRLWVSITPGDRVMEGRKAALTCESDANPPISQYTWFDWNNQDLQHSGQTLSLDPVKVEHSGSYWCKGVNQLGEGESPPSTLTIYYSPETIGRRTTMGIGICLAILILVIWGVKLQQNWKRTRSQQGPQENSNGRSFFVRNKKVRRTLLSEGPHSLGCYNPMMEDGTNYATLRFPETDTPRTGGTGPSETRGSLPNNEDTVTYSVVQKCHVLSQGDYENVAPNLPEDDGIHYSELVHFGTGERPRAPEDVDYVTLKH
ncbi:B-cell receptor CD22 isoform X1 [Marmota marmota marmota]|uniref:B-cell receptor CD22 isoform X1 n=1 Tax=Marmota marmota marmota TaxID=9994 RepID=UPI0007627DCE|nr:B-cell receptor CD22 isoform X1 [Marmota marmota marmota]XP_048646987.1 B-cell receptor CD22 isoform X1 [Marmota marmota marmota]